VSQQPSQLPPVAAGARSSGAWGSSLTCGEFAAVRSVGFEPVGQVFGAAVYAAGSAPGCPAAGGSSGPLVQAMYQVRLTAIDRMTAECARLGGHGVVGVRLTRGSFTLGGLEFTAVGTAVRAPGAAHERVPFTSDLSGQDFAKLIMTGWVPAGLALGVWIGSRHDDRTTARQARWGSGNAEITGWTELVSQARHEARRQLESDVTRLGAEGAVIAGMKLRVSQRDCPAAVGRHDHLVEATLVGTAIARFSRSAWTGPAWTGPAWSGPGAERGLARAGGQRGVGVVYPVA
jgi:uncharacterized protein YbjQ (UPF0145 family)